MGGRKGSPLPIAGWDRAEPRKSDPPGERARPRRLTAGAVSAPDDGGPHGRAGRGEERPTAPPGPTPPHPRRGGGGERGGSAGSEARTRGGEEGAGGRGGGKRSPRGGRERTAGPLPAPHRGTSTPPRHPTDTPPPPHPPPPPPPTPPPPLPGPGLGKNRPRPTLVVPRPSRKPGEAETNPLASAPPRSSRIDRRTDGRTGPTDRPSR